MKNSVLVTLRVLIALILFGALLMQALIIPLLAYTIAYEDPEFAFLAIPYVVAAILGIGCAEVVLVATWKLTLLVGSNAIFDASSLRWVTLMVRAAGVATVVTTAVALHASSVEGVGPITVLMALYGCAAGAGAFWLILVIMRGLLETAVAYKVELDEVI